MPGTSFFVICFRQSMLGQQTVSRPRRVCDGAMLISTRRVCDVLVLVSRPMAHACRLLLPKMGPS